MMYYLLAHIMIGLIVGFILHKDTNIPTYGCYLIGLFFSWALFLGLLVVILSEDYKHRRKRSFLQKEIEKMEDRLQQKDFIWTKYNYKEAEKMLLTQGSCLVLKNGEQEIPVPNNLKKDFYAFVNKGLTSVENYDSIYHDLNRDIIEMQYMYSPLLERRIITNGF